MSKRLKRQLTGKIGEFSVFVKLLDHGLVPYVPLVDEGIDCLLRDGTKIQIKTVKTRRDPRWFQVTNLVPEDNFYIICVDAWGEFWIFPSRVFAENATESKGIYDLDLDRKGRAEKLKEYRDAWALLKKHKPSRTQ
ncbi:MAG: hypothetical protein QMD13_07380 [Candidatus Bathyarchaeia archaeon]|nr:hypothetical protein [Candidatus Bathyarchaeia archaeon]